MTVGKTDYLTRIIECFPVRNSAAQKEAFRNWAAEEAEKTGYAARTEENGGHRNLVIGDPQKAKILFTAHYDTPRRALFPNLMMPCSHFLHSLYLIAVMLPMAGLALGAAALVRNLTGLSFDSVGNRVLLFQVYLAVYLALYFLLFFGPANRSNSNDNTSGTAAVLTLAAKLKGNPDAAFVLFDDEEKGKKGSRAYAAAHPDLKARTAVINMDCVGAGEHFIFSVPDTAEEMTDALRQAFAGNGAWDTVLCTAAQAKMNSDHKSFDRGIGVCACARRRIVGYMTGRIHTPRDTAASPENIEALTEGLKKLAEGTIPV